MHERVNQILTYTLTLTLQKVDCETKQSKKELVSIYSQHIISANCKNNKCVPQAILKRGNYLESLDGKYQVHLRQNGNLEVTTGTALLWSTGTINVGVDFLYFNWNELSLRGTDNKTIWKANSIYSEWYDELVIQNDGNLVIYNRCDEPMWATNIYEGTI